MNIYSLYVTRSKEEVEYFHRVLAFIDTHKFKNFIKIIHLPFHYKARYHNLKNGKNNLNIYN